MKKSVFSEKVLFERWERSNKKGKTRGKYKNKKWKAHFLKDGSDQISLRDGEQRVGCSKTAGRGFFQPHVSDAWPWGEMMMMMIVDDNDEDDDGIHPKYLRNEYQ